MIFFANFHHQIRIGQKDLAVHYLLHQNLKYDRYFGSTEE